MTVLSTNATLPPCRLARSLPGKRLTTHTLCRKVTPAASPRPAVVALFDFQLFGGKANTQKREELKKKLLSTAQALERGVKGSEADKAALDNLAQQLERLNPNKKALSSELINGKWRLEYTTSKSILGLNRPPPFRPSGPIFQTLDAGSLKARNEESWPLFNKVDAELIPLNESKVRVQFKLFKLLGFVPVKAPESATGALDVTYLDEDLRISRGNRSNLFVLTMADSAARLK